LRFLLDTNAISEIRRDRDARVRAWAGQVDDAELHLSVLTIGEVRIGIERLRSRDPVQADVFAEWLGLLHQRFADRILPVDAAVAEEWGRLNAPSPRNTVDSLISATARIYGMIVVTRNTSDFANCGVQLLNPWEYVPGEPKDA
jgi:predicted nucleic acid-binding protein